MSLTLGVLGGGQLGRMLALAGYPLGMRFIFVDPDPECPAGHVGALIIAPYDDEKALLELANTADIVTTEFENVPASSARFLSEHAPFFPSPEALAMAQDRLAEKSLFRELGIETPRFEPVDSREGLARAVQACGTPSILKTRRLGYDGKGQFVIRHASHVEAGWAALGASVASGVPLILESFVPFVRELSIIAVRSATGEERFYPLVENRHEDGILRLSIAPATGLTTVLQQRAERIARLILTRLNYIGVLTIELFELADGSLIANEMACRVHNSGHWTIEGAECSQFENHIRAVMGLPLGSTAPRGHCAMINLIGSTPAIETLARLDGAHVHLYGKAPRQGRKLGHVTITRTTAEERNESCAQILAALNAHSTLSCANS